MVLLRELKSSVKNPLEMRSFYILFVTAFVLLLVPLTVIGLVAQRSFFVTARNSCAIPVERSFSGTASKTTDGEHLFALKGANCNLTIWVNGSKGADISLWVYEPDGKIRVVDDNKNKSYEFLYVPTPVNEGDYRIAVRLKSGNTSNYTTTVAIR